ncbi:MAG: accessory gene regulator ArgB-like protein [Butyricicoccus sp.]
MKGIKDMRISTKITAFLIAQQIVHVEDREIYEYGFELLLADLFNFCTILLIGGISGQLWSTILYLLIFVALRSVCGGYHAKTRLHCHIGTIGVYLFFLFLLNTQVFTDRDGLLIGGDFIAAITVILFAPIQHQNKPLSEIVRKRNRLIAITLFFLLILVAMVLGYFGRYESIVISLTLWIVFLCMVPAIDIYSFTRRRERI